MPKDPTTPTKSAAGAASESPRKRWTPKKPSAEALDESKWRESKIKPQKELKKTDALDKYHLQPKDLEGLQWVPERYDVPGSYAQGTRKLYRERDVERRAWRRYGGPDGFAAYLVEGREHHQGVKPFKIPTAYVVRKRPERKVSDKVPQSLFPSKLALERKAHGNAWLWEACNEAIRDWGLGVENWKLPPAAKRAKYFQAAIRDLPNYPPRTPEPPQLSPALQALKGVLADAPVKDANGVPVEHVENSTKDEVSPAEVYYYWSAGYFTRVYMELYNVILKDGVGPAGWEVARWIIYDEYSKWSGIIIDEKDCKVWDNAYGWLQGCLPKQEDLQLEFSAFGDQNSPPLTWTFVNAVLPVTTY